MRTLVATGAALLLSLFAMSASAGTPGWYVGGEAGAGFLNGSDNASQSTGNSGSGGSSCGILLPGLLCVFPSSGSGGGTPPTSLSSHTEYDTGWLGGLTLGYLFDNGWRIEAEARYSQNDLDQTRRAGGNNMDASGEFKTAALMANVWYNFNRDGSWHPYVGGGIGAARLDLSFPGFSDNQFEFAYQGGVGLAYDFTDRLTGDIGYRYFATIDPTFEDSGTRLDTEYSQHVALVSLRYTFNSAALQDADGDGVPDNSDQCPETPAGAQVDANGCALDSDGDGVADHADQCPNTPQGIQVNSQGCPLDSDGDGVANHKDQCPNTPAGTKVDATGCPLVVDSDSDGVPDNIDQCPDTPIGVAVMTNGCAVGQSVVLEGVKFNFNKATLTPSATNILHDVIKTLKDSPGFNVKIAGYTDSIGSASYNLLLSQRRAASVKQYLVDNGIEAGRLTTVGHGENNPIASNDTAAGRATNRRVELTPIDNS